MSGALSPADLRLLKAVLALARELESTWPRSAPRLGELQDRLRSLSQAESPSLGRLAAQAKHLTAEMSARHFTAVLVPFERLLGRALRDDEFLVREEDSPSRDPVHAAPFIVIADNLRSAFNVGAIFRTAECFALEGVWLAGYTPTPEDEKTARTSMGTDIAMPWRAFRRGQEAVAEARSQGYAVIALETVEGATALEDFEWPERAALVLGNERFGLDRDLLAEADHVVRIPLFGAKNSLNVGIAFGIAAADWRRKRERAASSLQPIGVFRSPAVHPYEAPRQGTEQAPLAEGRIELAPGRGFEQALEDLEGFERLWLVYRFHRNSNWKPKILPPRGPRQKRGVFATRSPYRPNPLGLSCVELSKVDGLNVHVRGFDLLDGTPIYDIKPYLPYADAFPSARAGWTEQLDELGYMVELSERAERQLRWLEAKGITSLRGFLLRQLEYDPLDEERKRVTARDSGPHTLAYRTWRADFEISDRQVRVTSIRSGYTDQERMDESDPYEDKAVHREFSSMDWR